MEDSDLAENEILEESSNSTRNELSTQRLPPEYCLPSTSKADQKTKFATTPSHRATENASSDSGDEQKPPKKVVDQEKCKTSEDQNSLSRQSTFTPREEVGAQEHRLTCERKTENIYNFSASPPLNTQIIFSPKDIFAKHSGTTNIGILYEDLTIASFILKLLKDKTIENFFILSNHSQFGSFDDVVLEVGPNDCYAFQLKHVTNKTLTVASLQAYSGHFSIQKYFKSFQNCKETMSGYKLVLLTNAKFGDKDNVRLNIENIHVKMVKTKLSSVLETCGLVACCYKFQIANSSQRTKDHETFFENFILCIDQPSLQDLKKNLRNELKESFIMDDLVLYCYTNFIYQWSLQECKVKYKLSKNIMQKVLVLFILNPFIKPVLFIKDLTERTKLFQEVISKFNVTRFDSNLKDKVQKIWGNLKESLSDLEKVNKFNKMYQITKSYVTDVETLTNEECSKFLWVMNKCPLIVEQNSITDTVTKLFPEEKYVVLRTEITEQKTSKTNSVFTKLVDLKEYSELFQEILETFQCSLGGENISLEKLIKNNKELLEFITTETLLEMLEKPYAIESEEEELPMPYIDRFLSQTVISAEYFKNVDNDTFIVISNVSPEYKNPYFKKENFHVLETECLQEEFDSICKNNEKMKQFHHFRLDNEQFVWLKSKGGVSDLKKYVEAGHSIPETVFREQKFHLSNNIFLVSDEPGKGKSVLLKSFKNAMRSSHWTVLFTSNEISEMCKHSCETIDSFENYLFNVKFKKFNEFDRNILQFIYSQGKIVFMWDGLDEITSDEFNKVTDLISKFLLNFTHWITARTHLTEELEDKFCVLSRSTEQYNEKQQEYYIKERLKGKDNLEKIVSRIQQYFKNNNVSEFLSIPLQISMITELFLQDGNKYSDLLSSIFSLSDVYDYFVEEKLKLSYKTKSNINEIPAVFSQFKRTMTENYEKAALIALFETKILVELGINSNKFVEIEDGNEFGFITKFDKESQKMHFVHQSYAEYFAALYFSKKYKNIISLKTILFDVRYRNIRFFFDLLLAKGSVPHIAVLNKNLESLKNCADLNVTDSGGRNVLHLASSWGKIYQLLKVEEKEEECVINTNRQSSFTFDKYDEELLQFLLDKTDHTKTDDVFKMDPLSYAENSSRLYAFCAIVAKHNIDFSVSRKTAFVCNILYCCIQFRFDQVFNIFQDIKYIVTENLDSLLHLAAGNNCLRAFMKIISFKKYRNKINTRNRLGETALHKLCKTSVTEICIKQSVDFAKFLIKSGADIKAADKSKSTPIHVASKNGHYEIVDLLVKSGADVNAVAKYKSTPLHVACEKGHYDIVDLLLKSGANINAVDNDKKTPVYIASEKGHYKIVDLLIKSEAKINAIARYTSAPIHVACENGYYKIVELLIKSGADINAADHHKSTPVYFASSNGHNKIVELLLKSGVNINAACSGSDETPVHVVSRHGCRETLDFLIKSEANINAVNSSGETPIHLACHHGKYENVDLLIKSGADINAADRFKLTPIHIASRGNHYKIVELLIKSGASIDAADRNHETPVHVAFEKGHHKIADFLIKSGANINAPDKYKSTPMHVACKEGHYETVDLLIKSGEDINAADKYKSTPIHVACEKGHKEIVELLIKFAADINAADYHDRTPIHVASQGGHYEIVDLLIKSGAHINAANWVDLTPIHFASRNGHYTIVDLLINSGANINAADKYNRTPLYVASKNGHYEIVDMLIKSGANINAADTEDKTPIYVACEKGYCKIVDLLIKFGANINAANRFNKTSVYVASIKGHHEIVDLLVKSEANINAADNRNETPIHVASKNGHHETVALLIKSGADINAADNYGQTPIHVASKNGHHETVDLLIKSGANINAADNDNKTPIHLASKRGYYKIVDLLIKSGANINAVNDDNKTPMHVACERAHYEVVDLLIKSGADVNVADDDFKTSIRIAFERRCRKTAEIPRIHDAGDYYGRTPLRVPCYKDYDRIFELLEIHGANL